VRYYIYDPSYDPPRVSYPYPRLVRDSTTGIVKNQLIAVLESNLTVCNS
jgi:hypothetical protein